MSLVSGPGRGGGPQTKVLPDDLSLAVDKHIEYIKGLDTVREIRCSIRRRFINVSTAQR